MSLYCKMYLYTTYNQLNIKLLVIYNFVIDKRLVTS